jgi:mono/diheme cytochrome c family protein
VFGLGGVLFLYGYPALSSIPAYPLRRAARPDVTNGQMVFNIAGCAACHATVNQNDTRNLGGGRAFNTSYGTFYAPNISPDRSYGIGTWTENQFVNAVTRGVGKDGDNLYPILPYASYRRMTSKDASDLFAYLKTLPPSYYSNRPHSIRFPFGIRPLISIWKLLYLSNDELAEVRSKSPSWNRGRYLVEGPGHCAECHSPRDILGGIIPNKRFAGGNQLDGKGWIPNITPHSDGLKTWSKDDISVFLATGLMPNYDSVGGEMSEVVANTSKLNLTDRNAMADYLSSLPAFPGRSPERN